MLDFGHIPAPFSRAADRQIFLGNGSTVLSAGPVWIRPRGTTFVHILVAGQGGKGADGGVGSNAAGGVGGGSGSIASLHMSAMFLPEVLYMSIGAGGAGTEIHTWVTVKPYGATYNAVPANDNLVIIGGGAIGNAVTGGLATGTVQNLADGALSNYLSQAGGTGGTTAGTAGQAVAAPTTLLYVQGGSGGGGMSGAVAAAGGLVTSLETFRGRNSLGGLAGTSGVDGGRGGAGGYDWEKLVMVGGAGGGAGFPSATASNGGDGGRGAPGCGGGGGGAAVTGKTAGKGGRGGPGFVIITSW